MARIPESDIERLKNDVAVERLIESAGIALKKSGKDKIGQCPFHDDSEPSLVVTPAKNLWHCFGCQIGGGPIDWIMKQRGVSFRHAVELLKEGIPSLAAGEAVKRTTVKALDAPVTLDADDHALLKQTVDYYHATLKQSPEALAYLKARGLDHPDLVEHFQLGHANRTLGLRLPDKTRKAGADIRARLEAIGIYRATGHEHFNGSLVVPIFDAAGNVSEIYGRKLRDDLRPGTPKHLYLPGPHAGVWNEAAFAGAKEIILCEALIDAMTFWCAGYRNVTAAYGVEGFTDDILSAFQRHGIERVLIAYDRDDAGDHATEKLAERLMAAGLACYRILFPKGMDANAYALQVTPASKSLGILIRKAQWLGKGQAPQRAPLPDVPVIDSAPADVAPASSPSPLAAEPAPALPATPEPTMTPATVACDILPHEIVFPLDPVRYRVRGFDPKAKAGNSLRVNLLASWGDAFFVDTLDLYNAKQRATYIARAAAELRLPEDSLKPDLGRILLQLELLQAKNDASPVSGMPQLTPDDARAALALLQSPDLIERILADFANCGLIGEDTNKLVGYLAAVSRKLDRPLGIVIQSSSAAGKTSLMDAVLAFVPEEDKVKYSSMTGQSLFYMGETNLKNKALAIVEEEGASRASYALKLLQSEGELTMASTGKDPNTGNLVTQQYRVEGPVALLVTTTARDIDEELMNRCLVLSVDEGRAQTRAIHQLQRDKRTLEGLFARHDKDAAITLHQNAQRLLQPVHVLNPYARWLTFPDQSTRLRRDHEKYLTLIDTIAFLHQHQRDIKSITRAGQQLDYIEATLADIERANAIAHEVLGRCLDELPPQTRRLLTLIDDHVNTECARLVIERSAYRFSRRALREAIAWGDTQLRLHLERLVDLEYLLTHREGNGGKYVYELVYTVGDAGSNGARAKVAGLIDVDALRAMASAMTPKVAGVNIEVAGQSAEVAGRLRVGSGGIAPRSHNAHSTAKPDAMPLGGEVR